MIHLKKDKVKIALTVINLAFIAGLVVLLALLRNGLNIGTNKVHTDYDDIPTVTAEDGVLRYNTVSVKVPKENASYTVGFDWGKDDRDYPTVPSTGSVTYSKGDQPSYEVLLYRDNVVPLEELDAGKTKDNWFDDWGSSPDENTQIVPYEAAKTKGLLVKITDGAPEGERKYCSYNYYFVLETSNSIEQYVLELNFYDEESINNAESLFTACADTISIK